MKLIVAVAGLMIGWPAASQTSIAIVGNLNLDTASDQQTEGVKNGLGENNGNDGIGNAAGTMIGASDPGAMAYWQGFQSGASGGAISQLAVDLSVLSTLPTHPDVETFYLYSYTGADISKGQQIGPAIATVTAGQITASGRSLQSVSSGGVYQYTLISSLSSYVLDPNTTYAIVMMTSGASTTPGAGTPTDTTAGQAVGWAESDTEATGDMGEFDHINNGGNNGGAYGQMELTVVPEPSTLIAGAMLLLPFGASTLRNLREKRTV